MQDKCEKSTKEIYRNAIKIDTVWHQLKMTGYMNQITQIMENTNSKVHRTDF